VAHGDLPSWFLVSLNENAQKMVQLAKRDHHTPGVKSSGEMGKSVFPNGSVRSQVMTARSGGSFTE
jgi:hypothetical protein